MRIFTAAILLMLVGCGRAPEERDSAKLPMLAFDGAQATNGNGKVSHGERLTSVLGCRGCHGKDLTGKRFYELYASNLTRDAQNYSDAQFDRLIRHGERIDRRDLWSMPSEIFQHLSDSDFAALVAYLRTLRPAGPPDQPRLPWEPDAVELIAKGEIKPAAQTVIAEREKQPVELGARYDLGRYITQVTCAECHGPELKGRQGEVPDLVVAGSYTRAEFEKLITQGIPTGGRKLNEMMSGVAQRRFSHLTPHERDALHAYLKARADQAQ